MHRRILYSTRPKTPGYFLALMITSLTGSTKNVCPKEYVTHRKINIFHITGIRNSNRQAFSIYVPQSILRYRSSRWVYWKFDVMLS